MFYININKLKSISKIIFQKIRLVASGILFQHRPTFYIYAFSRPFYPKRLTVHSGYTFYCQYMCSLGIEPTTFALLTQCSTTEPEEIRGMHPVLNFKHNPFPIPISACLIETNKESCVPYINITVSINKNVSPSLYLDANEEV